MEQRKAELHAVRKKADAQKAVAEAAKQSTAVLEQGVREQQQRLDEAVATAADLRQRLDRVQAEAPSKARQAVQAKLHSLGCSVGQYKAREAAASARADREAAQGVLLRQMQQRLHEERRQRGAAATTINELRDKVQHLEQQAAASTPRACASRAEAGRGKPSTLYSLRSGIQRRDEPIRRLHARDGEAARQGVRHDVRGGGNGESASANHAPAKDAERRDAHHIQLRRREAFHRLGTLNVIERAETNRARGTDETWAIAADAGNKGREMDMIPMSIWDAEKDAPRAEALAAADLLGTRAVSIWPQRSFARARNTASTRTLACTRSPTAPRPAPARTAIRSSFCSRCASEALMTRAPWCTRRAGRRALCMPRRWRNRTASKLLFLGSHSSTVLDLYCLSFKSMPPALAFILLS
eukprot:6185659-Pleurochrysis_carterae.AAC.1